jgi:hypothetical protein
VRSLTSSIFAPDIAAAGCRLLASSLARATLSNIVSAARAKNVTEDEGVVL